MKMPREKISEEEKREKIRQHKREEYLKNADAIKARQRAYYYKKKAEAGTPNKEDKYKIKVERLSEATTDEARQRFILHFD